MNTLDGHKRDVRAQFHNCVSGSQRAIAPSSMLKPNRLRFRLIDCPAISEKNIVDGYWCTSYVHFQRCFCNAKRGTVNTLHSHKRNLGEQTRDRMNGSQRTGAIWRILRRQDRMRTLRTCGLSSIPTHNKRSSISSYTSVTVSWPTELLQPPTMTNALST